MSFKKATKSQSKLRAAIFGASGSGKTYTSLKIAKGFQNVIQSQIAVIDTERGSASKYADKFDFDVMELEKKNIANYIDAIKEAQKAQYKILVIDSLSHAWQELLEEIDHIAQTKFKGNTWSAWSQGTPKQRSLIDAILNFDGHIIASMRAKTEWETNENKKLIRVGTSPEQGKGIEYEFDFLIEITTDHIATIIKDRSGKFQDRIIKNPDESFGSELIEWLNEGAYIPQKEIPKPIEQPQTKNPSQKETTVIRFNQSFTDAILSMNGQRLVDMTGKILDLSKSLSAQQWGTILHHTRDELEKLIGRIDNSLVIIDDEFRGHLNQVCGLLKYQDLSGKFETKSFISKLRDLINNGLDPYAIEDLKKEIPADKESIKPDVVAILEEYKDVKLPEQKLSNFQSFDNWFDLSEYSEYYRKKRLLLVMNGYSD